MKKNKTLLIILIAALFLLLGAGDMYFAVTEFGVLGQTVINKLEKEVTVNENGIADAVEKLYDAVVVVGSSSKGNFTGAGTGFVYRNDDDKAYILTNNHVVSSMKNYQVKFTNNEIVEAKLVGTDEYADVAVLSVPSSKIISVATMGSSENARLGDTVFTIGAPLEEEYSWTVTRGILSGKDRLVTVNASNASVSNWVMKYIQTDAAINAGNSGGPIANSNGEVIGITNMKIVTTGVEGMSFSIPIEDALSVAAKLIEDGKIARPFLGVGTVDVDDTSSMMQLGFTLDSSITKGAVVGYIQKGSAADDAGIEAGDVIVKFGDYDITSSSYLKYYVYKYNVGDKVKVNIIRGKKEKTITIKLTEAEN